ncbi:MAG: hypothetical protein LBT88_06650 [Oscillospiraceae bacterium]|nr:hypothetical protein [Oscillospiraceae bacterium]
MDKSYCVKCGGKITFRETENGKLMPVEPTRRHWWVMPHSKYNHTVLTLDGKLRKDVVFDTSWTLKSLATDEGDGYVPHFGICRYKRRKPSADEGAYNEISVQTHQGYQCRRDFGDGNLRGNSSRHAERRGGL